MASNAQVAVTTYHNDSARTGQNTVETVLTPSNVNAGQFGKLFTLPVDGYVYAQPLFVPNLTVNGTPHNVLFVATEHDSVYAFDADTAGAPLWQVSFINPGAGITTVDSNADAGCGDLVPEIGITSTPAIDLANNTIYLTVKTKENGSFHLRLHALDLATGAEKFGGPVDIQGTFTLGTSTITYNPLLEAQRPGLLLLNNKIYFATASHCDNGPYHGWVFAYNVGATPMTQNATWAAEPSGNDGGIWMSGNGLAADSSGNVYFVTGNGSFTAPVEPNLPKNYGDSIVKLSTTSGLAPLDYFTPYNQSSLNTSDADLGSGGLVLLPDSAGSTAHPHLLVQSGKEGTIYLIDRDSMGHFHSGSDSQIVQSVIGQIEGTWSTPAYWNGSLYFGGSGQGPSDNLKAFSISNAALSGTPTSATGTVYQFPGPTVSISSNGKSNGIAWALQNEGYANNTAAVLHAYDATNLATELYNSNQNPARDRLGLPVKFSVPTVANGKVYVGTQAAVSVFGIVSAVPQAAAPAIAPLNGTFTSPEQITLTTATPGATIFYTTNGSNPTTSSRRYSGAFTVTNTTKIKAIAAATGYNNSLVSSAVVTIVGPSSTINESSGFTAGGLTLNGNATLAGTRLRLTDGGGTEAGSAFITNPIDIRTFTTDFIFQVTNPGADGFTFVVQGAGANALGSSGGGLGYSADPGTGTGPSIGKSIAVKFDLYSNSGEGNNSTGLYQNGAYPTTPAIDLGPSGISLHSGDVFAVHLVYDGTTLAMTLSDTLNNQSFATSWVVNIPGIVGGNAAWVGFTGGTGGITATQDILAWSYASTNLQVTARPTFSLPAGRYFNAQNVTLSGPVGAKIYYTTNGSTPTTASTLYSGPIAVSSTTTIKMIAVGANMAPSFVVSGTYIIETPTINFGSGFGTGGMQRNGSTVLSGKRMRLTDGGANEAGSAFLKATRTVASFTTEFTFQLSNAAADGFAFVLENNSPTALGANGGGLGYQGMSNSVALKFDLYSNSGEGTNSVGIYQNGAAPTIPAVDVTPSGIDLHSGDTIFARVTYANKVLTLRLTDQVTNKVFTNSWTIDIPTAIGASSAYPGFTGGTGGSTAIQDILTWQFGL